MKTNKTKQFESFMESMKGMGHDNLVDTLHQGFDTCFESSGEQRYVANIEFFVYAESDEAAVEHAKMVAQERRDKYDDRSDITSVTRSHPGSLMPGNEVYKK